MVLGVVAFKAVTYEGRICNWFTHNQQLDDVEIQLYDVYGRLLEVVTMGDARGASIQTTQIDLSRYAQGVYFVKAVAEGKVIAVRKVVKR